MKGIFLYLSVFLITVSLYGQSPVDVAKLELRGGLVYPLKSNRPFTGKAAKFYPGRRKKVMIDGDFVAGRLDGKVREFYPNGDKKMERTYQNGKEVGVRTGWYPDERQWWDAAYAQENPGLFPDPEPEEEEGEEQEEVIIADSKEAEEPSPEIQPEISIHSQKEPQGMTAMRQGDIRPGE